ncbi:MAG: nucleotidyltransferase domain-containing protein [Dehalococcoidales bacterium]|nr:nucleotidyltransferase domain-containing protein [Dehalococcoidales bacterium]
MISKILVSTVNQKILQFLSKYSDKEFHEREIVRRIGIASGSANRALNELFTAGVVRRRQEWRMLFYTVDSSNPAILEFKKLTNLLLLEPLVEKLKDTTKRIILFGSCSQGTDNSKSDMDVFVVTGKREQVNRVMENFQFPKGYEEIHMQPIIKTPVELLKSGESEQVFLGEVEKGIVLWESGSNES